MWAIYGEAFYAPTDGGRELIVKFRHIISEHPEERQSVFPIEQVSGRGESVSRHSGGKFGGTFYGDTWRKK